jgi:hypothetical protein
MAGHADMTDYETRLRTLREVEEALRLAQGLAAVDRDDAAKGLCEAAERVLEMRTAEERVILLHESAERIKARRVLNA